MDLPNGQRGVVTAHISHLWKLFPLSTFLLQHFCQAISSLNILKLRSKTDWSKPLECTHQSGSIEEPRALTNARYMIPRAIYWDCNAVEHENEAPPSSLSSNMAPARDTCRSAGFFVYALVVLAIFVPSTEAGGKTLVLLDNANTKETHSIFFNSLKGKIKQRTMSACVAT